MTLQGRSGRQRHRRREEGSRLPDARRPDEQVAAEATACYNDRSMVANRWTFYIDKTGKVAAIDTAVRPATSAEDMIAKLDELKIAKK